MSRLFTSLIFLCLFTDVAGADGQADSTAIKVGEFSLESPGEQLPDGWQALTFRKIDNHSRYRLIGDGGVTVVEASSHAAASGLIRKIHIDPEVYPKIRWRWKVPNLIAGSDVSSKQGDDYPVRLYITFAYDENKLSLYEKVKYKAYRLIYGENPPLAAISYLWSTQSPQGTLVPNTYTDRVMMFVVQSGPDRLGEWVEQERNVYQDYLRAYGEPPPPISGVAIMTDTDNTGEQAVAYYGDIVFTK
jgi:hypothetical protein